MKLLGRYTLAEFRRFFTITMSAFVLLFVLGDFLEKVDEYVQNKAAVWDVVKYMLYKLPYITFMVTPVAVLLSTLLALGMMSKNGEIIAMKASGIPLYKIVAPIFWTAVLMSGLILWANETVIPFCNAKAEYIRIVKIEKNTMKPSIKHDRLWFRGPNGEIVNINLIDFKDNLPYCYGVTMYRLDKEFRLTQRVDSNSMDWDGSKWILHTGTVYDFDSGGGLSVSRFNDQAINLPERPDDFRQIQRLSDEMNITELSRYIDRLKAEGYNSTKYSVDLHGKISFALANIIMVIVAVPFSLKTSRSGGMALGIGISILLAIGYWFLHSFAMSLGHAGRFPPFFAAWIANMLYCASGIYLLIVTDK